MSDEDFIKSWANLKRDCQKTLGFPENSQAVPKCSGCRMNGLIYRIMFIIRIL